LQKGGQRGVLKSKGKIMTEIFNRKKEKEKRRSLRNNMIDFYCPEIKLAIEVDGETHCTKEEIKYDKERQTEIENFGISFLRIKNEEVFENINRVILKIETIIDAIPLNPPFCKGGK
jgi:very-short-patch-repair endonuclease